MDESRSVSRVHDGAGLQPSSDMPRGRNNICRRIELPHRPRQRNVIDSASDGRRHAFLSHSQEKMQNPQLIQYPYTFQHFQQLSEYF